MPRSLFYPYVHRRLEHTLTRAVVRVAYPGAFEENGKVFSGNTNHIIGFIVAEPSEDPDVGLIMHYVYTRRDYSKKGGRIEADYRRQGIARKLIEGMKEDYKMDHVTFTLWGQELRDPEFSGRLFDDWKNLCTYNPELFNTLLPPKWEQGIVQTLNEGMAKAFNKSRAQAPVAF
jgi:GNAT superfamily N-acetyltransferase